MPTSTAIRILFASVAMGRSYSLTLNAAEWSARIDGILGWMFDHVAIAVADHPGSERSYRTVLSVLGVEPSHADAELVEWEDWDIGAADPEHPSPAACTSASEPVTRGRGRLLADGDRCGLPRRRRSGPAHGPDDYGGFLLDPDG
jgi:hypothetical protein